MALKLVVAATAFMASGAMVVAAAAGSPVRVTLNGVGGTRIDMHAAQVHARWGGTRFVVPDGSAEFIYIPICADSLHGVAVLFGPGGTGWHTVETVWVTAGQTPYGVGIGSTRSEVVRTFGSRLRHQHDDLYVTGKPAPIHWFHEPQKVTYVRSALWFVFRENRVRALGYGGLQWLMQRVGLNAPHPLALRRLAISQQ